MRRSERWRAPRSAALRLRGARRLRRRVGTRADEPAVPLQRADRDRRSRRRSSQLPLPPSAYAQRPAARPARPARRRRARRARAVRRARAARDEQQTTEQLRDAALYPLPPRPAADGSWPSPVEVVVEGDRISVAGAGRPSRGGRDAAARSGGWLIDLGERDASDPLPQWLRLALVRPGRVQRRATGIETSDDLRAGAPAAAAS